MEILDFVDVICFVNRSMYYPSHKLSLLPLFVSILLHALNNQQHGFMRHCLPRRWVHANLCFLLLDGSCDWTVNNTVHILLTWNQRQRHQTNEHIAFHHHHRLINVECGPRTYKNWKGVQLFVCS